MRDATSHMPMYMSFWVLGVFPRRVPMLGVFPCSSVRQTAVLWPHFAFSFGYQISNGVDLFGGGLFGAWYSFNAVSLFAFARTYVATSGDRAFLAETVGDRTVLAWLRVLVADWKPRSPGETR